MAQSYSGPGSPYWASMGFLGLILPGDHPVWSAPEEALPVEKTDAVETLPVPGWIVSRTRADGLVRVVNHGTDQDRKSTRLNSSHVAISYAVFCLKQKNEQERR